MKKIKFLMPFSALAVFVLMFLIAAPASSDSKLKTSKDKFSYTIGHNIGQGLKREGVDIDVKILSSAIEDVITGKKPRLTQQQMQDTVKELQKGQAAKREQKGQKAKKAGDDFLAKNKTKAGIKVLPSGLQYKVLTKAKSGAKKPKKTDTIVAHYKGTLIDGTVFDSSYKRGKPATFGISNVIKGWQEILPLMSVGAKWQVFIPSQLAYGSHGQGPVIGPGEALIFDIELIEIKKK